MIIEVERNNLFSWEYAEVRARLYPTSPTEIVSVRKDGTITIPEGQYRNIPIEQAELFARLLLRAIEVAVEITGKTETLAAAMSDE